MQYFLSKSKHGQSSLQTMLRIGAITRILLCNNSCKCDLSAVVLTPLVANDGAHRVKLLGLDTALAPAKVG